MIAGLNRKRKNAVDFEVPDEPEHSDRRVGRPSKGGEALRAKRYYVKNHLLILQKRKLRRYVLKVRKILEDCNYNMKTVKSGLDKGCSTYRIRNKKEVDNEIILCALNLGREDHYLAFLSEIVQAKLKSKPDDDTFKTQVEDVFRDLANNHACRLFQLSAYLSAYLLLNYAAKYLSSDKLDDIIELRKFCLSIYVISYDHLTGEELPEGFINRVPTT